MMVRTFKINLQVTLHSRIPASKPISVPYASFKEIGFQQSSASYDASEKYITPQVHLRTFWPGVFFCKNCGTINKVDFSVVCVYVSEASSGSTYERLHSICVF